MSDRAWVKALLLSDLEADWVSLASVNGRQYAIYDTPDGLHATLAQCSHAGALLTDGYFDRFTIECPLHQGCFDVRTGAATDAPATRPLRTFNVRVHDECIEIEV
jgi:nitrite reductase/ring-hydroxylating ferredoxin subunit